MSEILLKINKVLAEKQIDQTDREILNSEIEYLQKYELLDDVYLLYQKIQKGYLPGDKNIVNSMLLYQLGVTNKKPESTINVKPRRTYGRDGFPDIDMDFDYEKRHLVVEYIVNKYGREYVGNIGTKLKLKTKAALRRSIKILDPENFIVFDKDGKKIKDEKSENVKLENTILKTLPKIMRRADGTFVETVDAAYEEYSEFRRFMDQYPEVKRVASRMEGGTVANGVHPAGIVISPIPLKYICPLHLTKDDRQSDVDENKASEKIMATQFTMADVESLGLIKFDILGLSTKTAIYKTNKLIKERYNKDIDLNNLPLDDKAALRLMSSGKTDGCFQLEGHGMKQTLMQIGIDSFDDLVVAIAMYRPGPKDYIPYYAKRKKGLEKVNYQHPLYEKITKNTFGIIVYQEQCMQIFMELAGLTASQGYTFLKGCAKKKPELIAKFKETFISGCLRNKVEKTTAENIFADLEKFAGYAFNKAHSCSYAYESYKTAYLKAHYPTEFFAARLSAELDRRMFDLVDKYAHDAITNYGIKILPPNLNKSKLSFAIVDEKTLLCPILAKSVGKKAAMEIVKNQPYTGHDKLLSFAMSVGGAVNIKVMEALYDLGVWGKEIKKAKLLKDFENIKKDKKKIKGRPVGDMFSK